MSNTDDDETYIIDRGWEKIINRLVGYVTDDIVFGHYARGHAIVEDYKLQRLFRWQLIICCHS
jgi:hypothetical protein